MTVDDDLAVLLEMLERHDYYSRALMLSARCCMSSSRRMGETFLLASMTSTPLPNVCATRSGTLNPRAGAKDPKPLRPRAKAHSTSDWKTAWITGASRGIGRELALQLAAEGVKVAVSSRNQICSIDLAILNAGIHEHMDVGTFSAATAARVMAVNYLGIVKVLEALIPVMKATSASCATRACDPGGLPIAC